MKRILILTIILSNIGFSQDCENSILDEAIQNESVNQYFQLALSLNIADLSLLNDCDSDVTYTMFIPGNSVPTSSVATLLSLEGELINYILYYITAETATNTNLDINTLCADVISSGETGLCEPYTMLMLDGNSSILSVEANPENMEFPVQSVNINNTNINLENLDNPICACNGEIVIIDDLIWAPGVVSLEEKDDILELYPNPAKSVLNVPKITDKGILTVFNTYGQIVFLEEVKNSVQINTSAYQSGMYIVNFKSENKNLTESVLIN